MIEEKVGEFDHKGEEEIQKEKSERGLFILESISMDAW